MSENTGEFRKLESSSHLINEIAVLHQLKSERNTQLSLTTYYRQQVSDFEIKVSELKAQLMAKDYEIQLLTAKIHKTEASSTDLFYENCSGLICPKCVKTGESVGNSKRETDLEHENARLKSLLEKERQNNQRFEKQLKEIGENLLFSEELKTKAHEECKIKELEATIKKLSKENASLKAKHRFGETVEFSTAHKSLNSSELKISTIEMESSDSLSVANSSPRVENSIPELNKSNAFRCDFPEVNDFSTPKKFKNPEPPQTRCKSECPKRVSPALKPVRYVKCNLNEILTVPGKNRQLAEFCPSSMRKVRSNNS